MLRVFQIFGSQKGSQIEPKIDKSSMKICIDFWSRFGRLFWSVLGAKRELKSAQNRLKSLPGAKTAIFRKSCSRVHGSIDFEVRRSSKTTKNHRIHVKKICMPTERQKVRILSDLGSIWGSKTEPQTPKFLQKNRAKKKTK